MEGRRGKINKILIRQTGKIRAKLMDPKNSKIKEVWDSAMNRSVQQVLGPMCSKTDYELMTNKVEADLEAKAFFSLNRWDEIDAHNKDSYSDLTKVIGIGVGSSSTQVYSRTAADVMSTANTNLGGKPS